MDRAQCINQVELHPVAVATGVWKHVLADRDVVFWIDNEAARFGLIRGSSTVDVSRELITCTWNQISDTSRSTHGSNASHRRASRRMPRGGMCLNGCLLRAL